MNRFPKEAYLQNNSTLELTFYSHAVLELNRSFQIVTIYYKLYFLSYASVSLNVRIQRRGQ